MTRSSPTTSPLLTHRILPLLCFVFLFFCANAQYELSLGSSYVNAFGERKFNILGTNYHINPTHGFQFSARNTYSIRNETIHGHLNLGYRQLYFSGSSGTSVYRGYVQKFFVTSGLGYAISKRIEINALIEAENNLKFKDFNLGMGDLFRVSLALEGSYRITERLNGTLLFSRAMTPISLSYTISNPQYQARIGLNYQLL